MANKRIRIKDCAEVLPGYSAKTAIKHDPAGSVQVVMAQHLTWGEAYHYSQEHKLLIAPPRLYERYLVESGDILFMSRGANNYAVPIESVPQPAIAPLTFYILKPKAGVVPAYLAWCINQEPVKARLNEMRVGAGTPMIPRHELGEIEIPLPPVSLQQRIADLAGLQAREKVLLEQLAEETERLHAQTGKQLFNKRFSGEQE
jgi:restriction endonuclease S subunit